MKKKNSLCFRRKCIGIHELLTFSIIPYFTLFILIFSTTHARAQYKKEAEPYMVTIKTIQGKKVKGILYKVNENSIELRNYSRSKSIALDSQIVEIAKIEFIQIRKKSTAGKGIAIGIISGAFIGFIVGYAPAEKDSWVPPEAYGGIGAGIGAVFGGIIGAAVTYIGKTYKIKGEQVAFDQIKEKLKRLQLDPI